VLDIGCGEGFWGHYLKLYPLHEKYVVGIDIHKPSLLKAKHLLDDVVLCTATDLPFTEDYFDVSLSMEVIEHLPKNMGKAHIDEALRVSKKLVLSTPNIHGPGCKRLLKSNPHQRHLSHYTPDELKEFGAKKVWGIGQAQSNLLFKLFWPVTYKFPRLSYNLAAVFIS